MDVLRVLSTLAVKGAFAELAKRFHAATGTRVEADLAVQQISELKQVAGIEVVGPIPHELQVPAVFSAGRMATTDKAAQSEQLLAFLRSPEAALVLREAGLEP